MLTASRLSLTVGLNKFHIDDSRTCKSTLFNPMLIEVVGPNTKR